MACGCGGLGRRGLLAGAGGLLAGRAHGAGAPFRIDVHHHVVPPAWLAALQKAGLASPVMAGWTPATSLADMDAGGVATAMVSPTTPQVSFLPPAEAARVARESNEFARRLADDHPGRFGIFAMLPMPHVDECLKEIAYAFDTLRADGIGMMTSYNDKWLGYPQFGPVLDELNRRKAVVYTHPTGADCCVNLVSGIRDVAIEYGADTTRTIASLIYSGASARCADIRFIFSHGGGALTAVAERFLVQVANQPPYGDPPPRGQVAHELDRFFYDTAQVANGVTIEALARLVPTTQILFGSDFPYRTSADHVTGLAKRFDGAVLRGIERDNAARILPGV